MKNPAIPIKIEQLIKSILQNIFIHPKLWQKTETNKDIRNLKKVLNDIRFRFDGKEHYYKPIKAKYAFDGNHS